MKTGIDREETSVDGMETGIEPKNLHGVWSGGRCASCVEWCGGTRERGGVGTDHRLEGLTMKKR